MNMKSKLFFLLMVGLVALTSSYLSYYFYDYIHTPHGYEEDILRITLYEEPSNLNPQKTDSSNSFLVTNCLFEGLMRRGLNGQVLPAIAESYNISKDNLTYIFKIRKNAKWSNGDPVTAYDFEYSWKKALEPTASSDLQHLFHLIKNGEKVKDGELPIKEFGVHAQDKATLIVTLESPVPYFLELLCQPSFMPIHKESVEKNPNWAINNHPPFISNGPFMLTKWSYYDLIEVQKNQYYWDRKNVKINQIQMKVVADDNTLFNMFLNDKLDLVTNIRLSPLATEELEYLRKFEWLKTNPITGLMFYCFNTNIVPFNNAKVRKAFSLAVNRADLVQEFPSINSIPALEMLPPSFKPWSLSHLLEDGNITEAQKLFKEGLEELGIRKEDFPPITILAPPLIKGKNIIHSLQLIWEKAFDLKVEIKPMQFNIFLERLKRQSFQIASLAWLVQHNLSAFLDIFKYAGLPRNYSSWQNATYNDLLNKANSIGDATLQSQYLKKAEEILIEETPIMPLLFYNNSYLQKDYVKNVYFMPSGVIELKWAYIDKTLRNTKSKSR